MRAVHGSNCTIIIGRSAKKRSAQLRAAAAAAVVAAFSSALLPAAHGNTEVDVPNGTTNLASYWRGYHQRSDIHEYHICSNSVQRRLSGVPLGTINDLDATQTLTVADAAGSITLNGGVNSVPGGPAPTDALYVAAGGTLNLTGVPLVMAPGSTNATLDVVGTANIGTWSSTAGTTYTFTGGGTTNVGVTNTTTFLGPIVVQSGTLVNLSQSSTLGAGTIFLGGTSGSANATLIDMGTGTSSNGNLSNPITTQVGSTGTLRIGAISNVSGATVQYTGRITVTAGSTLTIGTGGNTGTFANTLGVKTSGTGLYGSGTINIDAGTSTGPVPDIVFFGTTDTNYSGNVNVLTGVLRTVTSQSAFSNKNSVLTVSPIAAVDLCRNVTCAGLNGSGVLYNSNISAGGVNNVVSSGTLAGAVYSYDGQITDPVSTFPSANPVGLTTLAGFTGTQIYTQNLNVFGLSAGTVGTVVSAAGTLEFTGNNLFAGTVSVSGGTLMLNGTNTFNSGGFGILAQPYVTAGTLSTSNLQNAGVASGIGTLSTLSMGTISGTVTTPVSTAGTLLYTGPTASTNLIVTGFAGNATFSASNATANLAMSGTGTLTLTGTSTYGGTTTVNTGTLDVTGAIPNSGTINITAQTSSPAALILDSANAIPATSIITGGIGTTSVTGLPSLIVNASQTIGSISSIGTTTFNFGTSTVGAISGTGSLAIGSSATLNTNSLSQGPINSAGNLNLNAGTANVVGAINGTGSVTLSGGANLSATTIRQNSISIGAASTVTIPTLGTNASTSNVSSLALSSTGTLDLTNNDMIIDYNTAASPLVSVKASLAQAYDAGAYDQPGITSSAAKVSPSTLRLGYAEASALNNGAGTTVFDGQTLTGGAVLVKYTLPGDTTLKGSVSLGDYNTVVANYNTGTLWTQGNFHYTGTTGLADYNSIIANFNTSVATTHAVVGPPAPLALASTHTNAIRLNAASPTLNAQLASDLRLEVNTASGDVSMLNTSGAAVSFTGYNIYDPSNNIQDSNNDAAGDPANEKLLSVASTAGGNTTPYRSSTNYRLWSVVKDNANTLSEGENNSRYVAGTATTYDTIVIPTGGSIDFGLVFGTATNVQDLTFQFSEPNASTGDPTTGLTFNGGVDYVAAPEPASFSILGIAAVGLLKRKRRNV